MGIVFILIVLSYFLATIFPSSLLEHISITLTVLLCVVLIFEVILRKDTLKMVEEKFTEIIKDIQIKSDKILEAANEANIEAIYSNRTVASTEISTYFDLMKLKTTSCNNKIKIDLLGICLRDFFKDGFPHKETVSTFFNSKNLAKEDLSIRIMILYPYSNDAVIRMIKEKQRCHESPNHKESVFDIINKISSQRLMGDSQLSMQGIWEIYSKIREKEKFQVKVCTISPTHYILRFNDKMFVESYHLGCDKKTNEITSGKIFMTCFSARPQINENRTTFHYLADYFEALWNDETTLEMTDIIDPKGGMTFLEPDRLKDELKRKIQQNITTISYYNKLKKC